MYLLVGRTCKLTVGKRQVSATIWLQMAYTSQSRNGSKYCCRKLTMSKIHDLKTQYTVLAQGSIELKGTQEFKNAVSDLFYTSINTLHYFIRQAV